MCYTNTSQPGECAVLLGEDRGGRPVCTIISDSQDLLTSFFLALFFCSAIQNIPSIYDATLWNKWHQEHREPKINLFEHFSHKAGWLQGSLRTKWKDFPRKMFSTEISPVASCLLRTEPRVTEQQGDTWLRTPLYSLFVRSALLTTLVFTFSLLAEFILNLQNFTLNICSDNHVIFMNRKAFNYNMQTRQWC